MNIECMFQRRVCVDLKSALEAVCVVGGLPMVTESRASSDRRQYAAVVLITYSSPESSQLHTPAPTLLTIGYYMLLHKADQLQTIMHAHARAHTMQPIRYRK